MTAPTDLQTLSGRLERGEVDSAQYLDELMRFVAAQIGCSRAGLRVFVDTADDRPLRCVAMYDATLDRMIQAPDIVYADGGLYLEQLERDGSIASAHAGTDPLCSRALGGYLAACNVASLMDMGFSVNGTLFGTFSCEQLVTPVDWTQRQLQSLRKIASRASLTLMHLVTRAVDTAPGALWVASTPNRLATMPMPLNSGPA